MSERSRVRRGRPPEPGATTRAPTLRVRVVEGPGGTRSARLPELGDEVIVGRSAACDLVVEDESVAERHLRIARVAGGLRLQAEPERDVFIGVLRIADAVVPLGTRFKIGETVLELVRDRELTDLRAQMAVEGLHYADRAMVPAAEAIAELAPFTMSVLIQGETGTGKEVAARVLHQLSLRRAGPFEIVDCGALPTNLVESELFGHEPGAFTGAAGRRRGAFERAHGGTLFLDEIGELPLEVQPVLLGILQRKRVRRVGGEKDQSVDVRVVAATNRSLEQEVAKGRFRADLFYRLASARVDLPPLRERPADIAAIAESIIGELTGQPGRGPLDATAWDALLTHEWPGNVRELRAVLERAVATGRVQIGPVAPPVARHSVPAPPPLDPELPVQRYKDARADAVSDFERHYLGALIERCDGNASQAAREAQMDRPHLLRLLRRHGLR